MIVEFYTTGPDCTLCERVRPVLESEVARWGLTLREIDVHEHPAPAPDYVFRTPVIHVDGVRIAEGRIEPASLKRQIRAICRARYERGGGQR